MDVPISRQLFSPSDLPPVKVLQPFLSRLSSGPARTQRHQSHLLILTVKEVWLYFAYQREEIWSRQNSRAYCTSCESLIHHSDPGRAIVEALYIFADSSLNCEDVMFCSRPDPDWKTNYYCIDLSNASDKCVSVATESRNSRSWQNGE